ncbi:hypothetical protein [Ornithinibacillus sp. 179-J 7C1 HS]|uniref:hypothetical protein n=1 Tax=Ornithinibacillus sp. 179-J 7C1 HS TaxID=3142384 RepID=UPI0039A38C4A
MKRLKDYYDKRLITIDEQIYSLLKKRNEISNNNPGFPSDDVLSNWAIKYDLYEDYLKSLFETMRNDALFKPRIDPRGFRKHLSVLQSIEKGNRVYSITVIRQYENASVIQLHIDWDEEIESPMNFHHQTNFELFLGEEYDCRLDRAGGSTGHYTYNFIVSPPLPDDVSKKELVFREYSDSFNEEPTGLEIVMKID